MSDPNFPQLLAEFENEMDQYWSKAESEIGEIIRCHLIVELNVNKCLEACYPELRENSNLRLTFAQKVSLLPGWCFGFPWIQDATLSLNSLRNKVAHDITFQIKPSDLKKMLNAAEPLARLQGKELSGVAIVREMALQAATALHLWSKKINEHSRHGIGAFRLMEERGEIH